MEQFVLVEDRQHGEKTGGVVEYYRLKVSVSTVVVTESAGRGVGVFAGNVCGCQWCVGQS